MTTPDDAPDAVTAEASPASDAPDDATTTEDAAAGDDEHVATGILAAEHRAQADIARRRRLLVGGAVLGLMIAGAVLIVMTVLQQRANTEAQEASDRAEARAAFAEEVVDRAEDYEGLATAATEDATALRSTLEQFLSETETSDEDLAANVEALVGTLEQAADQLGELTLRPVPEPPELVDPERAVIVLRELETLRAEAGALTDEIPAALDDVATWLGAVQDVNRAVADHVAQVEAEETTSDPEELIELWRAERPGLLRLSSAATAADGVPGLDRWAGAHQQYAADQLAWIEEAVGLLEDDDLDAYNDRFDELFNSGDPFGFNAAVASATAAALESPALLQLGTLGERAQLVEAAVRTTELTAAEQLSDDAPPLE